MLEHAPELGERGPLGRDIGRQFVLGEERHLGGFVRHGSRAAEYIAQEEQLVGTERLWRMTLAGAVQHRRDPGDLHQKTRLLSYFTSDGLLPREAHVVPAAM